MSVTDKELLVCGPVANWREHRNSWCAGFGSTTWNRSEGAGRM